MEHINCLVYANNDSYIRLFAWIHVCCVTEFKMMSFCSVIGSLRNSDMEPIKALASFVLRGLPYVSTFHFTLFFPLLLIFSLCSGCVSQGQEHNSWKNIFWQLRKNVTHCSCDGILAKCIVANVFGLQTYSHFLWTQCCLHAIIGIMVMSSFRASHTVSVSSSVDAHTGNDVIVKGLRKHELVLPWQLQ